MMQQLQLRKTNFIVADDELIQGWLMRYFPPLHNIASPIRKHIQYRLEGTINSENRLQTQQKVLNSLTGACAHGANDMQLMLSSTDLDYKLWESSRDLAIRIHHIYETLLQSYVDEYIFSPLITCFQAVELLEIRDQVAMQILPKFRQLMWTLEPLLVDLKRFHSFSNPIHIIGCLTIQMSLTRLHITKQLDPYERMWLEPYLVIIEDLMMIPWRRVCAATERLMTVPEKVEIIKPLLRRQCGENQDAAIFEQHLNLGKRGQMAQSTALQKTRLWTIGVLQMYLWLYVMESNTLIIQGEFVPLSQLLASMAGLEWTFVSEKLCGSLELISSTWTEMEHQALKSHVETMCSSLTNVRHSNKRLDC